MLRYRHIHLARLLQPVSVRILSPAAYSSETGNDDPEDKHPIRRTLRLLGNDMRKVRDFFMPKINRTEDKTDRRPMQSKFQFKGDQGQPEEFQTHCDILVIGGGGIGSSIAYWLKEKARDGLNVVVVEKDDTYSNSATRLSIGGLHHKFSLPENIEMSLFAADFLRNGKQNFGADIPLNYTPCGHLRLVSEEGAEALQRTCQLQNELGARNELLTPARLATRFPWLKTDGVALACLGLEKEGWFDPWALLLGYRRTAVHYGAHFVNGEVVRFIYKNQPDVTIVGDEASNEGQYSSLDKVVVQLQDGTQRSIKFALCVIAAGASSGNVAQLARIGRGPNILQVPLPVVPRERCLYAITTDAQNAPGISTPLTIDHNGVFFRSDGLGGNYICGHFGNIEDSSENPDAQAFFESAIRPTLAKRVPAFGSARIVDKWSGSYDYNLFDDNGIIGPHPYYNNLYIVTGFSGQGIQQTPALGRAISELIMDGSFRTIDLSRLSFDRIIVDRPLYELNSI
ncbi:FAD-dependent oxidoreductase domain-containing protein 1 [Scaptodrosophila lebanonensis]|uniref:FAD-dependent oxidoreductase domain-containing protein 1 n=1 Tax=Drosophila lebanonensis TaxID=7225 RepID=A0A6J2TNA5_DROLE|nr:FAD-dependent oxidoreductase domain-containing protein 1 [Scaptodrosophila lebanonensis]